MTSIKGYNIVGVLCASEHKEFFYKTTNEAVEEYEPVGVEVEYSDRIELVLFDNIYWTDEQL